MAMKDIHTSCLGLLMEGWRAFETRDSPICDGPASSIDQQWYDAVARSVILVETILQHITNQSDAHAFEEEVLAATEKEGQSTRMQVHAVSPTEMPLHLIERLVRILQKHLPNHTAEVSMFIANNGRPSSLVRYWVPVLASICGTYASVRVLTRRQDEIISWIINVGSTIIDFWGNWVVEPIQKLIGTIRHDEKSEIAIMSKNSLVADRASLERMVVDFVLDHPDLDQGTPAVKDTTAIVNAVKGGDLTAVLRAYERDLRAPFVGTVRGDLVRALLIQIQKTKVDVEIAISGIDALLKSQELVFGYVN